MASQTPPWGAGNVVSLPGCSSPPAPRTPEIIAAEMQMHSDAVKVHTDALVALTIEWTTACSGAAAPSLSKRSNEVLSLAQAAGAIGWEEQRLRRHIVRHNAAYPNDRIAHQPGGVRNSPWQVPMARLRQYVRDYKNKREVNHAE